MKKNLSALKLTLPLETLQEIVSIDGVWSFRNESADPFVLDTSWIRDNENDDSDDGEAKKIALILDRLPECADWRELDILYLWPE